MGSDIGGDGLRRWLLVTGNRRAVTVFLVVSLYVAMFPLSVFDQAGVNPIFGERSSVAALLNTLLSGVILLVSVVVSIASLFTSQELSPVGRQRERVDSSHEFRHETESILDREVSPVRPSAFLRAITQPVLQRAQEIRDSIDGDDHVKPADDEPDGLQSAIDSYVDRVADDTERVNQTLGSDDTDTFGMLLAALEYNYAEHLYEIRRLQSDYEDQLTDETSELIDELEDALRFFLTAREYFKSLYLEREFSNLTKDHIYVSLPTIVVVSYAILAVDLEAVTGTAFGLSYILLFAGAAYSLALTPFVVLTAYVLRVATVARNTVSSGPFILAHEEADVETKE